MTGKLTAKSSRRLFGRFRRSELLAVTAFSIVVVSVAYAVWAPAEPETLMIDHHLFTRTVEEMRAGGGYYESMTTAMDEVYGPARANVTETVRGYRMPMVFWLWAALPNAHAVWYVFAAAAAGAGLTAAHLAKMPLTGLLVTIYLVATGMLLTGNGWFGQYLTVELWAVPAMLGSVLMAVRGRWGWSAALAVGAVLIRELAAPLLVGGLALAMIGKAPRRPWILGVAAAASAYALHWRAAVAFIDPSADTPLLGDTGVPFSVLTMMGFGIPLGAVVGAGLWVAAVAWCWRNRDLWLLLLAPLALPFVGFLVDRPYWGILVVPFTLMWGIDAIWWVATGRRSEGAAAR